MLLFMQFLSICILTCFHVSVILLGEKRGFSLIMKRTLSYYLRSLLIAELIVSLLFWTLVTNLQPYWLQRLSFPVLPLVDLGTIVIWYTMCRGPRKATSEELESV
jgi:hypothetical protein